MNIMNINVILEYVVPNAPKEAGATKWGRLMETIQIQWRDVEEEWWYKDTLQMYVNYTSGLRTRHNTDPGQAHNV
jgi:hypothetical protein